MYLRQDLHKIFSLSPKDFEQAALDIFRWQHAHNPVYREYINALHIDVTGINSLVQIPFLPIRFFKTHVVQTTSFEPAVVFESSGTTGTINSRHVVKDTGLYEQSFIKTFGLFYGVPQDWCIIGLLPSYLERGNSSLVYMVNELINKSNHPQSGFYLHDHDKLVERLTYLENAKQKTLMIGVTFALLDFAERYSLPLRHTIVMETGGMKGRRKEMIRHEVHDVLKKAFSLDAIHSEYGMTELLSQAYSKGEGIFHCPPWMKVLVRDEEDPLHIKPAGAGRNAGAINVIDLANVYSCSFIATDDAGNVYPDGSFEVLGRIDNSDLRGCSLMTV